MITLANAHWLHLAVALGIGLLIGVERERRKGDGPVRAPAGVRTFALTALLGAISFIVGEALLLGVVAAGVAGFALYGYAQNKGGADPGLTSEVSLLLTLLLGALATREPALASSVGVTVAIVLAARSRMHHFASRVLTDKELHDALVLAGAALVIMPIMPDRYLGPFEALNPQAIWTIVILMLALSMAGHIGLRVFGPKYGLPLAGLISGFVSSALTISAMGSRARANPALLPATVAGGVLSTVATVVQMVVLLGATSTATLRVLVVPLACFGLAAVAYGVVFLLRSMRHNASADMSEDSSFSLWTALTIAATMGVVLLFAAGLNAWLGRSGALVAVAVAGLADTHSPAVSIATMVDSGKMLAGDAALPVLLAMSTNTATKMVLAFVSGGRAYALQIVPGLVIAIGLAWASYFLV